MRFAALAQSAGVGGLGKSSSSQAISFQHSFSCARGREREMRRRKKLNLLSRVRPNVRQVTQEDNPKEGRRWNFARRPPNMKPREHGTERFVPDYQVAGVPTYIFCLEYQVPSIRVGPKRATMCLVAPTHDTFRVRPFALRIVT